MLYSEMYGTSVDEASILTLIKVTRLEMPLLEVLNEEDN